MKLEEMRQKFEELKKEVRTLSEENKVAEAEAKMKEVRELKKNIEIQEELERQELEELRNIKNNRGDGKMEKVNEFRSVVKAVLKKDMTEEERSVVKSSDVGTLIPEEYDKNCIMIQKGYGSLEKYCDVRNVTKPEGRIPVIDLEQNEMKDVAEGDDIQDGSMTSTEVTYKCDKVGLIIPLSSEVVEDAEVEIEGAVKENFNIIATRKKNVRILNVLKDNATDISSKVNAKKPVQTVLAESLDEAVPAIKNGQMIITNPVGYSYLKNLTDSNGQALNLITNINGVEYFHGYQIVTVDEALISHTEGKTMKFYIANMKEAVLFPKRKGTSIDVSGKDAGFRNDTTLLRVLERCCAKLKHARSIRVLEA